MKKRVVSMLILLALACAGAFAGAETDAVEAYCGVWVADDLAVEIWREDGELNCRAVFSEGVEAGVVTSAIWEYCACFYDEDAAALQCGGYVHTRERYDTLIDALEEESWSMNDLSFAEIRRSGDSLVLTDEALEHPVALRRLSEAAPGARTEALAYAGLWRGKAAALRVEDHGACYRFTVTVPVDAETSHRWSYICLYVPATGRMESVSASPRTVITHMADGGSIEVEEDYIPGGAEFALGEDGALTWRTLAEGEDAPLQRAGD